MTLTRRLTLFFLLALAAVLVAFSLALFLLARAHLRPALDDRLTAALSVLTAATEVDERGVEWEPNQRAVLIPHDPAAPVRWAVRGDRPLDGARSGDEDGEQLPDFPRDNPGPFDHTDAGGRTWRVRQMSIQYDGPTRLLQPPRFHSRLTFTVAVGVDPTTRLLARLALVLVGVSAGVLLLAALLARWLCRRALAPVRRMASAASDVTAADLAARLPVPAPPDELRELATAFNGLLARVQLAYERQAAFTGQASHQLRTPLTALMGQTELALRRDRAPDEYRRALDAAHREARRLHKLVEALLFLARAEGESRMPEVEPLDLSAWLPGHLAASWADHPRRADLRGLVPDAPAAVAVHPPLFAQAVNNVIDNAFKYGTPDTPVVVTVAVRGDRVVLTVDNQGPPIPEDERGQVFEPFFRSADARRRGIDGAGLGLSVAAGIVRAFGGKIAVVPHRGGVRVAISMPVLGPALPAATVTSRRE